jgi:hypothetical protein
VKGGKNLLQEIFQQSDKESFSNIVIFPEEALQKLCPEATHNQIQSFAIVRYVTKLSV